MSSALPFYDAGAVRQIATNLFYGWGYNFYRVENQLRSDDQMVREKSGWLLGLAHGSVVEAEQGYRRDHLPAPSRQHPFPDSTAVGNAQRLELLGRSLLSLSSRLQALPVPEGDRMTERFRAEAPTLTSLLAQDEQLVGQCELLRQMLEGKSGAWLLDNMAEVQTGLEAIAATLVQREAVLHSQLR